MKNNLKTLKMCVLFGMGLLYLLPLKAQESTLPKCKATRMHVTIYQNGKRTVFDTLVTSDGSLQLIQHLQENGLKQEDVERILETINTDIPSPPSPHIKLLELDTILIPGLKLNDCLIRIADTLMVPKYDINHLEETRLHVKRIEQLSSLLKDSIIKILPEEFHINNEDIRSITINEGDSVRKTAKIIMLSTTAKCLSNQGDDKSGNSLLLNNVQENGLLVYPNPGDGQFKVVYEALKKGTVTIKITNTNYQTVYVEKIKGVSGLLEKEINISAQPKGTYLLTLEHGNKVLSEKLMIE